MHSYPEPDNDILAGLVLVEYPPLLLKYRGRSGHENIEYPDYKLPLNTTGCHINNADTCVDP